MKISVKLIRYHILAKKFSSLIEQRGLSKTEISKKMWVNSPSNLINVLNWNKSASEKYFLDIAKAIWLNSKEIENILLETELEVIRERFWEDINVLPSEIDNINVLPKEIDKLQVIEELEDDFLKEMSLSREFRNNDAAIEEAKKIWEFMKSEIKK